MRRLLFILLVIFAQFVHAQPYSVYQHEKYGFIDDSGVVVLPAIYEKVAEFKRGLCAVKLNGSWGVINQTGAFLVDPNYDHVEVLGTFLVGVKLNGKYGMLDFASKDTVPPVFDQVSYFDDSVLIGFKNSFAGLFSKTGEEIIPCVYLKIWQSTSSNHIVCQTADRTDVYSSDFQLIKSFSRNADVFLHASYLVEHKEDRWRVVYDKEGRFVDSIQKVNPYNLTDAMLRFKHDADSQVVFIYNNNSTVTFPLNEYDTLGDGFMKLSDRSGLYALYTEKGEQKSEFEFNEISYNRKSKFFYLQANKGNEIRDLFNNKIGGSDFEEIIFLSKKLLACKREGFWGVMHVDGSTVLNCSASSLEGDSTYLKAYIGSGVTMLSFSSDGALSERRSFKNYTKINIGAIKAVSENTWWNGGNIKPRCLPLEDFGWFNQRKKGKMLYGLRDSISGDTLIKARYTSVCVCDSSGNTVVGYERKSKSGLLILDVKKFKYDVLGIVDRKGKKILPTKYVLIDLKSFSDTATRYVRAVEEKAAGIVKVVKVGNRNYKKSYRFIDESYCGLSRVTKRGRFVYKLGEGNNRSGRGYYFGSFFSGNTDPFFLGDRGIWDDGIEDAKWGYVNQEGEEVIKIQYDFASNFRNGVAFVRIEDKWGAIDSTGTEIIPIIYENIRFAKWNEKVIEVKKSSNKWGLMSEKGDQVFPPKYRYIKGFSDGYILAGNSVRRLMLLDKNGNPAFTDMEIKNFKLFKDGVAAVQVKNLWGIIDVNGKWLVDPKFNRIENYSADHFVGYLKNRWWVYRIDGSLLLKNNFTKIDCIRNGFIVASRGGKYGVYTTDGEVFIKPRFLSIEYFEGKGFLVRKKKGYGWYSLAGEKILSAKFTDVKLPAEGKIMAIKGNRLQCYTADGKIKFKSNYRNGTSFRNNIAAAQGRQGTSLIDTLGSPIDSMRYNLIREFYDSSAVVMEDNKYALITSEGIILNDQWYSYIGDYSGGFYRVKLEGGGMNFLNSKGAQLNSTHYNFVSNFENGYAIVGNSGRSSRGVIDSVGNTVVSLRYYSVMAIPGYGFAFKNSETTGYFDLAGTAITGDEIETVNYMDNLVQLKIGNKTAYLNKEGELIWKF